MELEIGIACGQCDTYSPMNTAACPACGHDLSRCGSKPRVSKSSRPRLGSHPPGSKLAKMSLGTPAPPAVGSGEPGSTEGKAPGTLPQIPLADVAAAKLPE